MSDKKERLPFLITHHSSLITSLQVSPPRTFNRYGKRSLPAKTHSRHQSKGGGVCDADPERLQKWLAVLHGGGFSRRGAVGVGAAAVRGGGAGAKFGRGAGGRGGRPAEGVAEGGRGAQVRAHRSGQGRQGLSARAGERLTARQLQNGRRARGLGRAHPGRASAGHARVLERASVRRRRLRLARVLRLRREDGAHGLEDEHGRRRAERRPSSRTASSPSTRRAARWSSWTSRRARWSGRSGWATP